MEVWIHRLKDSWWATYPHRVNSGCGNVCLLIDTFIIYIIRWLFSSQ
jgi:hypothetical protein